MYELERHKNGDVMWSSEKNKKLLTKLAKEDGATIASIAKKVGVRKTSMSTAASGVMLDILAPVVRVRVYPSRIMQLYRGGLSITKIAEELGCSYQVVAACLKSRGVKAKAEVVRERRAKVLELFNLNLMDREIADRLDVNVHQVTSDRRVLDLIRPMKGIIDNASARRVKVTQLTEDGLTASQIANELGCNVGVVNNDRHILGIKSKHSRLV